MFNGKSQPFRNWGGFFFLFIVLSIAGCKGTSATRLAVTNHGSDRQDPICQDFRLTVKQAQQFFDRAKPITESELHDHYEYLPCWVEGTLTDSRGTSVWKIRPIGIGEVRSPDGQRQLLGCKDCDDLFK